MLETVMAVFGFKKVAKNSREQATLVIRDKVGVSVGKVSKLFFQEMIGNGGGGHVASMMIDGKIKPVYRFDGDYMLGLKDIKVAVRDGYCMDLPE